jgi:hypothetical protein
MRGSALILRAYPGSAGGAMLEFSLKLENTLRLGGPFRLC